MSCRRAVDNHRSAALFFLEKVLDTKYRLGDFDVDKLKLFTGLAKVIHSFVEKVDNNSG